MCLQDTISIIEAMRRQEEDVGYNHTDYMFQSQPEVDKMFGPLSCDWIDTECREKMVDWCYEIVNFGNFDRNTVEIAFSLLDRFLATEQGMDALYDRRAFQLAAITSLYTSVKVHDPSIMDPLYVSCLSHGTYTVAEVEAMEFQILQALKWRVNPPTSFQFVQYFLELIPSTFIEDSVRESLYELTRLQTEAAVRDYRFIMMKTSELAFASLMNALQKCCVDSDVYEYVGSFIADITEIEWRSTEFKAAQSILCKALVLETIDEPQDVQGSEEDMLMEFTTDNIEMTIAEEINLCAYDEEDVCGLEISPRSLTGSLVPSALSGW